MSWFDTKGLASLAKTALKEAQKQIDKVLDIQDEEPSLQDQYFNDKHELTSPTYTSESNALQNAPKTTLITVPPKMGEINKDLMAFNLHSSSAEQIVQVDNSADNDCLESTITQQQQQQQHVTTATSNSVVTNVELTTEPSNSPASSSSVAEESIVIISTSSDNGDNYEHPPLKIHTFQDLETSCNSVSTANILLSSKVQNSVKEAELQTVDTDSTQSFEDVNLHSTDDDMQNSKPQSSSNRSDCSPLNSNDELETATSSDIEIISSPNCDASSSTTSTTTAKMHSKQKDTSNATLTARSKTSNQKGQTHKGHYREPSEISIISMDSQSEDELEKLTNRIAELNSIVEAKTVSLLEIERKNSILQSRNNELQSVIDANNLQSTEDYTKRMSALEKKFQASIREREFLRLQIKELQDKIPHENITQSLMEKQTMVEELRKEGEKLSKEILQQSNIIKKLRAKEKTTDGQLKNSKEQLLLAEEEVERLKRTLSAKEEVERTQIEAVHKMASENKKLEKDNNQLNSKLEDNQQKLNTLQHSFEAVKIELQQRSKQNNDLNRTAEAAQTAEKHNEILKTENKELQKQLQELCEKLRLCEQETMKREQQLREENRQLMARIETAELRAEQSTQEISETTTPLMRHIESLQQTLDNRSSDWSRREQHLQEKLQIYERRLKSFENIEISTKDEISSLKMRCKQLQNSLTEAELKEDEAKIAFQFLQNQKTESESKALKQISELNDELEQCRKEIKQLKEIDINLQKEMEVNKSNILNLEANRINTSDKISDDNLAYTYNQQPGSPSVGTGMNLLEEIIDIHNADWQQDDIECVSNAGHPISIANLGYSFIGSHNTTSTLEHLQSLLKQKDGELMQHQWEISRLQAERNLLQEELSQRTLEIENMKETLHSYEITEINYNDLQTRYDALLQMYGEKVEHTQELQLDLKECREAYKTQIQELLAKLKT